MEHNVRVVLRPGSAASADPNRMREVTRSPGVVRDLLRRGQNVANYQRRDVPAGGKLQATIRTQLTSYAGRPAVQVSAGRAGVTPYLGYYHDGTRPHPIEAKRNRPNAHLRFVSGGRVVFAKRVMHPGFRGNPFIRESLSAARP